MSKWSDIKMYDLSIPIGISTPPWPTYEPLQVKYFKRLAPNGANGQLVTHSNHVGTHLDGPRHFDTAGRDIAALELTKLCAPGVVVDLSDMAEDFGIYTPEDIEKRVEVREGDILIINTGYHKYGFDQPTADERRYMLRHPGPSLDFIKWVREKKIKQNQYDEAHRNEHENVVHPCKEYLERRHRPMKWDESDGSAIHLEDCEEHPE